MGFGDVNYEITTRPTKKLLAKHLTETPEDSALVRIYTTKLTEVIKKEIKKYFHKVEHKYDSEEEYFEAAFLDNIAFFTLLERICLSCRENNAVRVSRGLPKKIIRGRCKEYKDYPCKMMYVTNKIFDWLK